RSSRADAARRRACSMVVGLVAKNGERAVELLAEHETREAMREGELRQAPALVGALEQRARQAVGAADEEGDLALSARGEALESPRELAARHRASRDVERHHGVTLGGALELRRELRSVPELDLFDRAIARQPAGVVAD